MANIKRLNISTVKRNARTRGVMTADQWNDTFDELTSDLSALAKQWNQSLLLLVSTIPDGTIDSTIDAFKFGLDGKYLWVDSEADGTASTLAYYNSNEDRPFTVKEQFASVLATIIGLQTEIDNLESNSAGLTAEQKARIGANIFDSEEDSASTSLDGLSTDNQLNIQQVGRDLYGDDYDLNADGNPILDNSLKDMVSALLELHDGSWTGDFNLNHDDAQADIEATGSTSANAPLTLLSYDLGSDNIGYNIEAKIVAAGTSNAYCYTSKIVLVTKPDDNIYLSSVEYELATSGTSFWTSTAYVTSGTLYVVVSGEPSIPVDWKVNVDLMGIE